MAHVYSVEEAAEKLGLEASHVRRLLRNGEIKGKKLGHDWAVLSLNYERKRRPKTKRIQTEVQEGKGEQWTEGSL
ncbi:MAG: helix-turn-helix domain-containing protein [Dehalococcoidia bacterium]|nr:helix-turn-helix domain-containing protein [Dehalococcoidia bacterium]